MQIVNAHQTMDELFARWEPTLGRDHHGYRNHAYRVFNLSCALTGATGDDREKLAVASAFHDIGIWLDDTFDYLGPSVQRAVEYLATVGCEPWSEVVAQIINQHHKLFPWRGSEQKLVESFRRADWLDVFLLSLPTRLGRSFLAEVLREFPREGFHGRLVFLTLSWCLKHPFNPLPMFRL